MWNTDEVVRQEIVAHKAAEDSLHHSEKRAPSLQNLTAELAAVVTSGGVPNLIADKIVIEVGERLGAIAIVKQPGGFVEILGTNGITSELLSQYRRIPIAMEIPITYATRTGESVWLGSYDESIARFPELQPIFAKTNSHAVLPCL